eukprot:gene45926-18555_t
MVSALPDGTRPPAADDILLNRDGWYEARAATGKWWPVTLTARDGDTFSASVRDGHGTVWGSCAVTSLRRAEPGCGWRLLAAAQRQRPG